MHLSAHPAPLDTERLRLRARGPEHAATLFATLKDPEVWRFAHATPVMLVEALVDTRNRRSIALLERLHFHRVATLHGADRFKGSVSDEYRYAWRPRAHNV